MSSLIQFFSEEIDFTLSNETALIASIEDLIVKEKQSADVINIIFCNDNYLLDLNQRFLERDTLTDVIAFDYKEEEGEVAGDIFISIDRARDNALKYDQTEVHEVIRVIFHGILHLCGYADKTDEQKAVMTSKEDYYLSLLPL